MLTTFVNGSLIPEDWENFPIIESLTIVSILCTHQPILLSLDDNVTYSCLVPFFDIKPGRIIVSICVCEPNVLFIIILQYIFDHVMYVFIMYVQTLPLHSSISLVGIHMNSRWSAGSFTTTRSIQES